MKTTTLLVLVKNAALDFFTPQSLLVVLPAEQVCIKLLLRLVALVASIAPKGTPIHPSLRFVTVVIMASIKIKAIPHLLGVLYGQRA